MTAGGIVVATYGHGPVFVGDVLYQRCVDVRLDGDRIVMALCVRFPRIGARVDVQRAEDAAAPGRWLVRP